ncbi:hypothetical protein BGW80DRAFT_1460886 [Lactifluus volemus]|nr:hypothetical protein BGW80DRAFT_1460886 [Lactifluus volemus]
MSSLSKYFFDNYDSDISRLNVQYAFLKTGVRISPTCSAEINISHVSKAIDIATGTGAWALDFASLPDKKNAKPRNKFFQQDVTKHSQTSSLEHSTSSTSCTCLTPDGKWMEESIEKYHGLLRPGGHLILRENDNVMYDHEHPPPLRNQVLDPAAYMQGTSVLVNVNRFLGWSAAAGLYRGGQTFASSSTMLEEASLQVIAVQDP